MVNNFITMYVNIVMKQLNRPILSFYKDKIRIRVSVINVQIMGIQFANILEKNVKHVKNIIKQLTKMVLFHTFVSVHDYFFD